MHPSDLPPQFGSGHRLTAEEATALARAARSEQRAPGFTEGDGRALPPRPVADGGQLFECKSGGWTVPEYSLFVGYRREGVNRAEPPLMYLERDVERYLTRKVFRGILLTNGDQRVAPYGHVLAREVCIGDVLKLGVSQTAGMRPTVSGDVCRLSRFHDTAREYFTLQRDYAEDGDFVVVSADTGDLRYMWFERTRGLLVSVVRCEEGVGQVSGDYPYETECWAYDDTSHLVHGTGWVQPLFEADGTTRAVRTVRNTYNRSVAPYPSSGDYLTAKRTDAYSPWYVDPPPYKSYMTGASDLTCMACGDPLVELERWVELAGLVAAGDCEGCDDLSCGSKLSPFTYAGDGVCEASWLDDRPGTCPKSPRVHGRLRIEYVESPSIQTTVIALSNKHLGKFFFAFKKVIADRVECVDDLCDMVLDPTADYGATWCDQSGATLTVRCAEPTMCATIAPPTTTTTPDPETTTTTTWDPDVDATTTLGPTTPFPTTTTTLPASTTTTLPPSEPCDDRGCIHTWDTVVPGGWSTSAIGCMPHPTSGCGCDVPDFAGTVSGQQVTTPCYRPSSNPCRSWQCSWVGGTAGSWSRVSAHYVCASPCTCPEPDHASYFGELAFTNCDEGE